MSNDSNKKERVLIGMSGGVDSSVAALILKNQGYDVVGAIMALWGESLFFDELKNKLEEKEQKTMTHCACLSPDKAKEIEQARKVAEKLGIEFHVIDCSSEYEEKVINYFKSEYMKGRTPNPCVCCNKNIKFGSFLELARKSGIKFDKFATGHYAKIEQDNGVYILKRGKNPKKDQSYFLYGLTQEQLKNTLMPLGDYTKEEIREIAFKNGFDVANKPDSQDFYVGDYNDILNEKPKKGNIVDRNGKILGQHQGFWNYTIGQRKGIGVSASEPLYVVELRKETNEVVVAFKAESLNKKVIVSDIALSSLLKLDFPMNCQVKIRSSQEPKNAEIKLVEDNKIEVVFDDLQTPIATGQSAVFYDNDIVLGGGIIEKAL